MTIWNLLLLCYCFIGNNGGGGWVQAVDNNSSFRQQSQSSRFRIGSTNDILAREKSHIHVTEPNRGCKTSVPYDVPVSAPTAAPTAVPSSFADTQNDRDEHNAWLLQQQQQQHDFQSTTFSSTSTSTSRKSNKGLLPSFLSTKSLASASQSFLDAARAHAERVHRESPTTFWTTASSIFVFLSWQLISVISALRPILMQFFLTSRQSAKETWGLSLILSAVSHNSFRHLLVNLLVFLNLSPALTSIKVPSSSWASKTRRLGSTTSQQQYAGLSKAALWPFLVGGALSGNLLFLLFRPGGSCLGLSSVTCAMLGAYAGAVPDLVMRIRVYGVIPVSLRTGTLVQVLLAVSLAGSLFMPSSPICHLGHLGGLLFGLLYYQNVMISGSKQKFPTKLLFGR
jgi:membrane associated rhomboid family serine protease